MSKTAKGFIKGALILSIAGFITKFLSMFLRIPLTYLIRDEGLGYYQMPYPLYSLMTAIAYIGIPTAISKIVSEKMVNKKHYEAHKIFKSTFIVLITFGTLTSSCMFFFADFIVKYAGWAPEAKYPLLGLACSPIFVAIMGAFRGYFQGMQDMVPTAISQVLENLTRVISGITFAYLLVKRGVAIAAFGAAFGATVGGIIGSITLTIIYLIKRKKILALVNESKGDCKERTFLEIIKPVISMAIPISIGAAMSAIMNLIDSMTVVNKLASIGLNHKIAAEMFGQLSSKAMTLINVPLTISAALVLSIVPAVSEAIVRKDNQELNEKVNMGTKLAMLLSLPSVIGLYILAQPILTLVYGKHNKGADILAILAISLIFIILGQLYTGILQGMGCFYIPIINLMIAGFIKWILNYILINENLKILGAAISAIIAYFVYALLNYISVKKRISLKLDLKEVLAKPIFTSTIMGIIVFIVYELTKNTMGDRVSTLLCVLIGTVVYGGMLVLTGSIDIKKLKIKN